MAFVQFTGVSLAFGARDILSDAALYLASGTKAALAGPNGAGKTTLLRIVAGLLPPDSGDRAVQKGTRVSYLAQSGESYSGCTVYQEAEKAYGAVEALLAERDSVGARLESSREGDDDLGSLLETYHHLDEAINGSGYWRRADRIREVLEGLGFKPEDAGRQVGELSGGWQMRVALAKVLLENPDIMLLDEPTNYLDLEARDWLESYLGSFAGGFVVVSHDRSFLDSTVNEVYELWNGRLTRYPGSYTAYERKRAQELETLFKAWEAQQEEIARLEDFIRRFRYQATKAAQVQSRIKQLDKVVPIVIPEGMKRVHFSFPPAPHSGRIALTLDGVRKSYGPKRVVDELSLTVDAGSKIAFVGRNGAGKSTLMRLVAGVDGDYEGSIRLGTGITVGYFSQDVADALDESLTVEEEASSACPTALLPGIRNLLGAFLFRGDDVEKRVSVLSGGERSRLALLKMLLHPANLLVLDEPTNHLDLDSKDVLLDALKRFDGTVLFVSHDRFFIEGLADRVLELSCGSSPRLFYGDYAYYLTKKAEERAGEVDEPARATRSGASFAPAEDGARERNGRPLDAKASRELDKRRKAERNRLRKREDEILARMEAVGKEKADALAAMALPENYSDGDRMRGLQARSQALDGEAAALSAEWEVVATELEGYADVD
ncbi:MAG TPA: ABC-F family ATP-binding cassette domain-containing protein [Spirochaetales bacterium]|nr:ABC-F family ATP-binding cassette domain-containing protein [Spirochaetales bacterium]HPG86343.1 ABC-F family ATP-binding cassette domain-containing protein [Spirochaetales bacterium]